MKRWLRASSARAQCGPAAIAYRNAGFTLVEILVVLTILGLLGGLVLARGPARSAGLEIRLASDTIAQTLRLARARAMVSNRPTKIMFDPAQPLMRLEDGSTRWLPAGLAITVQAADGRSSVPLEAFVFLPDGSSSGGRVEIGGSGRQLSVTVSWLTGEVSVLAGR